MKLDKEDLQQIEKIVQTNIESSILASEKRVTTKIITVLTREIRDQAEINREVIKRVDRIETKLGLSKAL